MVVLEEFDDIFDNGSDQSLTHNDYETIREHRRRLDGELFFDRLLKLLRVNAARLYPPKTNDDLRELHGRIVAAPIADHNKQSLFYYILKDFDDEDQREEQSSLDFANRFAMPGRYRVYVDGLWELDHLNFRKALDDLTDPSCIPTFPDEILDTLLRHTPTHEQDLALVYYHTVSPPLANEIIRDSFFKHLAKLSITEAYIFSRQQSDPTHRHLFELLITSALKEEIGEARAARCVELVNLPFDREEEDWFEEHLIDGNGKSLHGAKDTVMVRRIAMGKMKDALKEGEQLSGRNMNGVTWNTVKNGINAGLGTRMEAYHSG
ncbi:hypothetical protein EV356DRAFT_574268 [Viridothelium virens]|uniref:ELYS-like domain-containing protein n=1 Tax=Viridothelium virens TaxID=1048519 RepID=A0A6A6HHG7_VIRVR|nr:hypothetical protein EV356DRAFT_574268 [Viridothelium virens]